MQSKPMTESEVAKWVGKDKNLEWMPVNPYSTNRNDFGEDEYFSYKMSCHNSLAWENGKISTARGILEYLIAFIMKSRVHHQAVYLHDLESMLKQMEDK